MLFVLVTSLCVSFTLQFEASCRRLHVMSIKAKVKVKVILEQATKTQKGSRSVALLFLLPRR
jgi:predicted secreted Zn-dependent protease